MNCLLLVNPRCKRITHQPLVQASQTLLFLSLGLLTLVLLLTRVIIESARNVRQNCEEMVMESSFFGIIQS